MTMRRGAVRLVIVGILVIGILLLGLVPKATAETVAFKSFSHVTKAERVSIPDVEGHSISLMVREGVAVLQNGEWAWATSTNVTDLIKGTGTVDAYAIYKFMDGSTFMTRRKGNVQTTPQGASAATVWTGDIINGTGRFQGIKGTMTMSTKILSPEQGEPGGKTFSEGTFVYTLPGK
jgi:hypothetical protein